MEVNVDVAAFGAESDEFSNVDEDPELPFSTNRWVSFPRAHCSTYLSRQLVHPALSHLGGLESVKD